MLGRAEGRGFTWALLVAPMIQAGIMMFHVVEGLAEQ